MKIYLILFLSIFTYDSYAREFITGFEDYNPIMRDFDKDTTKEYYYQILLKEWLKDADQQELTPIITEVEYNKSRMSIQEMLDSSRDILKRCHNIDVTTPEYYGTSVYAAMGGINYPFMLNRLGVIETRTKKERKLEQIWILFSEKSKRAVSLKEKIKDPDWKKVCLPELRDNNVYTFFLRKSEWGSIRCPYPQKQSSVFSGGVDSIKAFTIVTTIAAKCYGAKITHIATKYMGTNKEHCLVYGFSTISSTTDAQENAYKMLTIDYKKGHPIWNTGISSSSIGPIGYRSFLGKNPITGKYAIYYTKIVTALISRETGQILFME